jgi:hypothetical protein
MSNFKSVEEAKAYLTEQGFYTGNLWCVDDVQANYDCTQEEAQDVLDGALNNEATMEQIWFAINYHAQENGLERKETFSIGESVEVPEPNDSDIHNHSFVGVIVGFRDNGNAVVEDGDGDCFEIEVERLKLI